MDMLHKTIALVIEIWPSLLLGICFAVLSAAATSAKRFKAAFALAALAAGSSLYLPAFSQYISGMSVDSFSEISFPDRNEASFFFTTIAGLVKPLSGRPMGFACAILSAAWFATSLVLRRVPSQRFRIEIVSVVGVALIVTISASAFALETAAAAREMDRLEANLSEEPQVPSQKVDTLKIIVYIGESTSAMNWQLYGYARQTTPKLAARYISDRGLLVYKDMWSTHTHTSPSLIDTFSLLKPEDEGLPIYERRYLPITRLLQKSAVKQRLISNQSQHGTWATGGRLLFKYVDRANWGVNSKYSGNTELQSARRLDEDVLMDFRDIGNGLEHGDQVVYLHSYAGHGPYLLNIPRVENPWSDEISRIKPAGLVGDAKAANNDAASSVADYDHAMRYIDGNLDRLFEWTNSRSEAIVSIYFSDHGESPWTGNGHDSSRATIEMLKVPAIVHFNKVAQSKFPEKFESFRAASRAAPHRRLPSIGATILDLLNLQHPWSDISLSSPDASAQKSAILIRRVRGALVGFHPTDLSRERAVAQDSSDFSTKLYRLTRSGNKVSSENVVFCMHRSDTVARLLRAVVSTGCAEIDLAYNHGKVEVFHPPAAATGFAFTTALDLAGPTGINFWLDLKDLPARQCEKMVEEIDAVAGPQNRYMAEFSPNVELGDEIWRACAAQLRNRGIAVSYYVPTDLAERCSSEMSSTNRRRPACESLYQRLEDMHATGWFSDLSFDYGGVDAVKGWPRSFSYRYNTWGVNIQKAQAVARLPYRMILVDSQEDPNFH